VLPGAQMTPAQIVAEYTEMSLTVQTEGRASLVGKPYRALTCLGGSCQTESKPRMAASGAAQLPA